MNRQDKIHSVNVELINMMLEKHGITYDTIIANCDENKRWLIDGKDWYYHYTMTKSEYDEFRKKAIALIAKKLKLNKKVAEEEFSWWFLNIGLVIEE